MSDFFLGIDVSKGYGDFALLNKQKEVVEKPFQIDDTFDGHCALTAYIDNFFKGHTESLLYAGMESTGGYEDNWYVMLVRLRERYPNLKVTRINPVGIKKHHDASMQRNVTDQIAAVNIASYMISYPEKLVFGEDAAFNRMTKEWNVTQMMIKHCSQLQNQLGMLLYQSHPGLVRYCKNSLPQWILELLIKYPTARHLSKAKKEKLSKIPYITEQHAQELIDDAKKSVASHTDEIDGFMITQVVRQINSLDESIAASKKHMEKECSLSQVELLRSFIGIGTWSAIGLLVHIVSVTRFKTVKDLVSYFGLHPVYRQSGDGTMGMHMSKKGNPQMRSLLFMVSLSASVHNPVINRVYEECLESPKKMEPKEALGVCMHKILRIVYGMLKSNKPFDATVDEKFRSRKIVSKKKSGSDDKKRRFQKQDDTAPISYRQTKTRKEKEESMQPQKNIVLKNGVNACLPKEKNTTRATNCQKDTTPDTPKRINNIPERIDNIIDRILKIIPE